MPHFIWIAAENTPKIDSRVWLVKHHIWHGIQTFLKTRLGKFLLNSQRICKNEVFSAQNGGLDGGNRSHVSKKHKQEIAKKK